MLIVGVLVFRERAGWRDWLLLVFCAAGVGVILYYESRGESLEAVLWGLASGVFYAGVVLVAAAAAGHGFGLAGGAESLVTAVALSAFALGALCTDRRRIFPAASSGCSWRGFGILQMGLPYVLFARGLQEHSRPRSHRHRPGGADPRAGLGLSGLGRSSPPGGRSSAAG